MGTAQTNSRGGPEDQLRSGGVLPAGTLIRTGRGEVAVEDLQVGDRVETTSGKSRPIVWLGNSKIDFGPAADPTVDRPVRIAADAFGPGMPYRDLTLLPRHGICVRMLDEVIIPPFVLVNGATITQLDVDHLSYWHVELDAHDIMYANGLPTESYIRNPDASEIEGQGTADAADRVRPFDDDCRPYVADGAVVSALRERLALRAEKLGWSYETSPFAGLHLEVDGTCIEPMAAGLTARFALPADAREVWLVSAASVPAQVMDSHDTRRLGVLLWSLRVGIGAAVREIALDDAALCVGFHATEIASDGEPQRWTTGRARLPASLWEGSRGDLTIQIELAAPPLPKWLAPTQAKPARDGRHLALVVS